MLYALSMYEGNEITLSLGEDGIMIFDIFVRNAGVKEYRSKAYGKHCFCQIG